MLNQSRKRYSTSIVRCVAELPYSAKNAVRSLKNHSFYFREGAEEWSLSHIDQNYELAYIYGEFFLTYSKHSKLRKDECSTDAWQTTPSKEEGVLWRYVGKI